MSNSQHAWTRDFLVQALESAADHLDHPPLADLTVSFPDNVALFPGKDRR